MYSPSEIVDMVLIVGESRENYRAAAELYAVKYPTRRHPSRKVLKKIVANLRMGDFSTRRKKKGLALRHGNAERIMNELRANPHISQRNLARRTGMSRAVIQRFMKKMGFKPFHISIHQSLSEHDIDGRKEFCMWGLSQLETDPDFFNKVLFSDEATFCSDGILNRHNSHYWAVENPRWLGRVDKQHRWKINVWCGLIAGHVIGPYFIPGVLTGDQYADFIRNILPTFLEELPLDLRQSMWFQHDGCPAHYSLAARRAVDQTFPQKWIGRGGPVAWPPRSPDLNPLDYFLWGYLKNKLYAREQNSPDQLRGNLVQECLNISSDAIKRTTESLGRRLELCLVNGGGVFEHLM